MSPGSAASRPVRKPFTDDDHVGRAGGGVAQVHQSGRGHRNDDDVRHRLAGREQQVADARPADALRPERQAAAAGRRHVGDGQHGVARR